MLVAYLISCSTTLSLFTCIGIGMLRRGGTALAALKGNGVFGTGGRSDRPVYSGSQNRGPSGTNTKQW